MVAMKNLHSLNPTTSQQFSDRYLLRRFIQDADESAFAEIVQRHASLVMSVCRRVVGQSADVDDAFQATFFALSRRPPSLYAGESLAGWLYSVARRTSVRLVRLRNRTAMQTLPEQTPSTEPDPLHLIAEAGDLASLDEELNRLPEKYRDVLVMNYFAQQSSQEIADQLNESKGAVDGRIRDARQMLRVRLERRGVEVGVLTAATMMAQSAAADVPGALIQSTTRLGSLSRVMTGIETVPGVDLVRMQLLTSTGSSLMTTKTGFAIVAGVLLLTGIFGVRLLADTQDDGGAESELLGDIVNRAEFKDQAAPAESGAELLSTTQRDTTTGLSGAPVPMGSGSMMGSAAPMRGARSGAALEFSRTSARAAERQLNELMSVERIPALEYPGDESLGEVLQFLANHLSESRGDKLLILLDERDPDIGADSEFLNATTVSNIGIPEGSMTIASALDLIFAKVKDQNLTWIAKDNVLLITTTASANSEEHLILRSYDITKLRSMRLSLEASTDSGGGLGGGGMGGMGPGGLGGGGLGGGKGSLTLSDDESSKNNEQSAVGTAKQPYFVPGPVGKRTRLISWEEGLVTIIMDMTSPPCLWIQNGDDIGSMSIAGNRLLVRQTRMGHEKVVEVLDELELAAKEMGDIGGSDAAAAGTY